MQVQCQYALKWYSMKIESENSIKRLCFLCYLQDIKIVWINPWNWLNWFQFFIFEGGLLVILIYRLYNFSEKKKKNKVCTSNNIFNNTVCTPINNGIYLVHLVQTLALKEKNEYLQNEIVYCQSVKSTWKPI